MSCSKDSTGIPVDILDDLSSRFIINIPEGERTDPIRLFFQIELAHWFYLDFHRAENSKLKSCGMKEFSKHILKHIPSYSWMLPNIDMYYDKWKDYKMSVPTYGAIILNEDMSKVLLVQSYFERTSWGFPKGKVNEDEDPVNCAAREVLEETGCDISALIKPDDYLEAFLMEQRVRLYVIHGIKETEQFQPQTRCEIKCVQWFTIADLPMSKKDTTPKLKGGVRPNSFFMVLPFVKRIKSWIQEKKAEETPNRRRPRHKSLGDSAVYPLGFPAIPPFPSLLSLSSAAAMPIASPPASLMPNLPISTARVPASSCSVGAPRNRKQVEAEQKNTAARSQAQDLSNKLTPRAILSRRKLFDNEQLLKTSTREFIIPSWLNFKLDREPLLKCFDI